MPAYLTHAHVFIEMVAWLALIREKIDARRGLLGKDPLNALDERFYYLAGRVLDHLKDPAPSPATATMPVARIKNRVGDGLAQFGFVGSLGPDFAAASNILAMNQRWASATMHNGAPRRAWVDAKSTTLILKFLERIEREEGADRIRAPQRRNMVAFALGYLSHIAADVVLHPAVHQLAWDASQGTLDPLEQQLLEVAIDARLAKSYFQRTDLNDDVQSWTDYYLDTGDFKEPLGTLMEQLSGAFKDAYGDVRPNQPVCGLSDASACVAPTVDKAFLMDGYSNTVNWALDAGYDHGPLAFDVFWSLAVFAGAMASCVLLAKTTAGFSTISRIEQSTVDRVAVAKRAQWQRDGVGHHEVWRNILDKSYSWPRNIAKPFEWLMGGGFGMILLTFNQAGDGYFGQGTSIKHQSAARIFGKIALPVESIGLLVLEDVWPGLEEISWWDGFQWVLVALDIGLDVLEHFTITNESRNSNVEGDAIVHALWWPKKILFLFYLTSNALVMVAKSVRKADDGSGDRESGVQPLDFAFPLLYSVAVSALFIPAFFRDYFFEQVAQSHWPSSDSSRVDKFLPEQIHDGKHSLVDVNATKFKVRLFDNTPDVIKMDGTRGYFPEADVPFSDVEKQPDADRKARAAQLKPWPGKDYALKELLDHSARFAGLLAMSAIAYNEATAPVREHMTGVFKDWNLDFATVDEWKDLLLEADDASMGTLHAAKRWSDDLIAGAVESFGPAVDRLQGSSGVTEVAGLIKADFVRDNKSIDTASARSVRLKRPGAILLPNLDIDEPAPSPLVTPLPSRAPLVDSIADEKVSASGNDKDELTHIKVRKPGAAGSPHTLVLALHADDASRVRVFEVTTGTPDTWPVRLGATAAGAVLEFELPLAGPDEVEFAIEAKSFGMDPGLRAPTGPGPLAPSPFPPGGVRVGDPTVPERRPHEVWLELKHKDAGAIVPGIRDAALFTIAPFLLQPNTDKTERIYAVSFRDQFDGAGNVIDRGNHSFIADIIDALSSDPALASRLAVTRSAAAFGTFTEFVAHQPVRPGDPARAKLLYLADGDSFNDQWIQDEFEMGYAQAPNEWMHVVLHSPRRGNLDQLGLFVVNELAEDRVGLFNGVSVVAEDSIDFGGNLEVSPPVPTATPKQAHGNGGPEMPDQPAAPMGKIILGDGRPFIFNIDLRFAPELQAAAVSTELQFEFTSHDYDVTSADTIEVIVPDREWVFKTVAQTFWLRRTATEIAVHGMRPPNKHYAEFLDGQRAQPVVRIDTSWLDVGHVDEILTFVPAIGTSVKKFRLLMASSDLGIKLYDAANTLFLKDKAAHPLTKMFRRHKWLADPPRAAEGIKGASITVDDMLSRTRAFNTTLQTSRLTPIEDRLRATLALDPADIVRVPVIYDTMPSGFISQLGTVVDAGATLDANGRIMTAAFTPNAVNLLVVDDHVLLPKPFGARMSLADTTAVLATLGLAPVTAFDTAAFDFTALVGHETWAHRGTTVASLSTAYNVGAALIKGHARNAGKFTSAGAVIKNWERIFIPENNVDLLEAFLQATLMRLGLKIHFIDDWNEYHRKDGEVHCGTNALRTPPQTEATYLGTKWWDAPSITG